MAKKSKKKSAVNRGSSSKLKAPAVEVIQQVGRPSKYEPRFCDMLIEHGKQGLSFESFAAKANCCFDTLYQWAKDHPEFSEARSRHRGLVLEFYEQVLRNVAMGIVPEAQPGTLVTKGNATAAIYLCRVHGKQAGFQDDGRNFGILGGGSDGGGKDTTVNFKYIDAPAPTTDEGEGT